MVSDPQLELGDGFRGDQRNDMIVADAYAHFCHEAIGLDVGDDARKLVARANSHRFAPLSCAAAPECHHKRGDHLRFVDVHPKQEANAIEPIAHAVAVEKEAIRGPVDTGTALIVCAQGGEQIIAALLILSRERSKQQPGEFEARLVRRSQRASGSSKAGAFGRRLGLP